MTIEPPAAESAKKPRSVLAGPYGHPFHPILVTVPIGAWVASFVFDLASMVSSDNEAMFAEASYWLIGLGILGALAAAAFGFLDLLGIPRGTKAWSTGVTHMSLNLAVVALFVVGFLIRAGEDDEVGALPFVISLVALSALGASGWLGGKLAYRYGVRVADEATQAEGYR